MERFVWTDPMYTSSCMQALIDQDENCTRARISYSALRERSLNRNQTSSSPCWMLSIYNGPLVDHEWFDSRESAMAHAEKRICAE